MAYADNHSTSRKLGAGAAVLALEAGLAWAVIAGLAMTINRTDKPRIATFAIPDEPKIIPPPPKPQASAQPDQPAPRPRTEPIYDLGPSTLPTFIADDKLGSGDAGTVEFPRIQPSPVPVEVLHQNCTKYLSSIFTFIGCFFHVLQNFHHLNQFYAILVCFEELRHFRIKYFISVIFYDFDARASFVYCSCLF